MPLTGSRGNSFWVTLQNSLAAHTDVPAHGSTPRQVILGVTQKGVFLNHMTADVFFAEAIEILVTSGRVYRFEDTLCFEIQEPDTQQLLTIATREHAESGAAAQIANLFCVGVAGEKSASQALPTSILVNAVLADRKLWKEVPRIRFYSRRPVFDANFTLRGPGWHPESGLLIHGQEIEPIMPVIAGDPAATALDRLPPLLRALLSEYCWHSEPDMVNTLAMLLTGLLINHFVDDPHPGFLIDGNQPGLGKTVLIQVLGRILDGFEPARLPLVRDDELEKKLCAQLRDGRSGIFFFDNMRGHIESALLEANMLSPLLCFRILGRSATISRPNAYLWIVTANLTSGTSDFLRRNIPIRLHYAGDPKKRDFKRQPLNFAVKNRPEILGELAGLITQWVHAGRPLGKHQHRCTRWAEIIGGILDVAGVGNLFLANLDEAEAAMDDGLQSLTALAEFVVEKKKSDFLSLSEADSSVKGQPAKAWTDIFISAEIDKDNLASRSGKGRDTVVGQFLSGKVDRVVDISVQGRTGTATLHTRSAQKKQKLYWFEVVMSSLDGASEQSFGGTGSTPPWGFDPLATVGFGTGAPPVGQGSGGQPLKGGNSATVVCAAIPDDPGPTAPCGDAGLPPSKSEIALTSPMPSVASADDAPPPNNDNTTVPPNTDTTAGEVVPPMANGASTTPGNNLDW